MSDYRKIWLDVLNEISAEDKISQVEYFRNNFSALLSGGMMYCLLAMEKIDAGDIAGMNRDVFDRLARAIHATAYAYNSVAKEIAAEVDKSLEEAETELHPSELN